MRIHSDCPFMLVCKSQCHYLKNTNVLAMETGDRKPMGLAFSGLRFPVSLPVKFTCSAIKCRSKIIDGWLKLMTLM